jgi:4-aminobutyrate aminotransferase-like enzyme
MSRLARKLRSIVPIPGPTKAALFNSGAEAVENAVKIARSATGRPAVLAFDPGFHGRTLLALSLTTKASRYRRGFGPFAPEVYRLPIPDLLRRPHGTSVDEWVGHTIRELHRCLKSTVDPQSIARAIIEPVMGEGGFIVPPREFLADLAVPARNTASSSLPTRYKRALDAPAGCSPPSVSASSRTLCAWRSRCPMDSRFRRWWGVRRSWTPRSREAWAGHSEATRSRARGLGAIETLEQDGLVDRAEAIGTVVARRFEEWWRGIPSSPRRAGWRHARARTG